MADDPQSSNNNSDGGHGNGWQGRNIGGYLPVSSGNHARTYIFRRSFKNIVKTTDMNKVNGTFSKYESTESGIHNIGHFAWAEPESEDYLVPYFLTTWVTMPKWEQNIGNATSYRITKSSFMIDKMICREWLTKNNEEVFVPNPSPYFDVYKDIGSYIGYGNLVGITKVPNSNFRLIQPMKRSDTELLKYKYRYATPIGILNDLPNTGKINDKRNTMDVKMINLHDWREMDDIQQLRQGDSYMHVWENKSLLRKPITNTLIQ